MMAKRIGAALRAAGLLGLPVCVTLAQPTESAYLVLQEKRSPLANGIHVVRDTTLENDFQSYTLRYEAIEPPDTPNRILPKKWAPTIGYTPIGIAAPSMACWYNQGFFKWTLDDVNLKDYRPAFRVVRRHGKDVLVEYSWKLPNARVTAAFALTANNDKLIFFGRIEPIGEIHRILLRLMAYPATFSKPWNRRATTALRTLASGSMKLDLQKEKWVLLEDVTEGRIGDGPAGVLLGNTGRFKQVEVTGIGGYAEYVDLELKPECRSFVLGLYEMPGISDVQRVRREFRAGADVESDNLAKIVDADLEEPLPYLPAADPERIRRIRAERTRRVRELLSRPAERWQPRSEPLPFDWFHNSGGPVRVALLCPRWAAYETMELARRVKMEVEHQYFDTASAIVDSSAWPYAGQTGIGPLGGVFAGRHARNICEDPSRDVILITGLAGSAIPQPVREAILRQVKDGGKGLLISGNKPGLAGWPREMTAHPDPALTKAIQETFADWEALPGLHPGERGRIGEEFPLRGFRFGKGRVLVWQVNLGRYSAFSPLSDCTEGLDGAFDRICAIIALALRAAAGRPAIMPLPVRVAETVGGAAPHLTIPAKALPAAEAVGRVLVRLQDDLDRIAMTTAIDTQQFLVKGVPLRPQPAGRTYFLDILIRGKNREVIACGSTVFTPKRTEKIEKVLLAPLVTPSSGSVPMVDLAAGGELIGSVALSGLDGASYRLHWVIEDALGRILARGETPVPVKNSGENRIRLRINRPVTVCHHADVTLVRQGRSILHYRQAFTIPVPYPFDDFTYLLWSYAGGEPVTRRVQRLCYEYGADMMDICHMRGYTDRGAAREYAVAARSGLRLLPYVTRIANNYGPDGVLKPGLFNQAWIDRENTSIRICTRQAAPYCPPAYTLGDENYLARGTGEFGRGRDSMTAFRAWLKKKYGTIERLNAAWKAGYASFGAISAPVFREQAAKRQESFVPWFDHRRFFDEAFAALHVHFAGLIRALDPDAKVGWDGFLGYDWKSGYNFYLLTRDLDLNQVYSTHPFQCELVRGFAGRHSLRGEWGNAIADNEAGFRAISWVNLFRQHNSCWWWTSWGCYYTPFNPDTSLSFFGEWFFDEARYLRAGIGKLLLHAQRRDGEVAVLYNQADLFAAELAGTLTKNTAFAPGSKWNANHQGLIRLLKELGLPFRYVAAEQLDQADPSLDCKVLVLPLATCLSELAERRIREFAEAGGLLLADGRVGLLTQDGRIRGRRAAARVFGVEAPAGKSAFAASSARTTVALAGQAFTVPVIEPGLKPAKDTAYIDAGAGDRAVLIRHATGAGYAVLLNIPFSTLGDLCLDGRADPFLSILREACERVGVHPVADIEADDAKPRRIEQVLFQDGELRYLGLQQDITWRTDIEQKVRVHLLGPAAYVYEPRGQGLLSTEKRNVWTTRVARGKPCLFSLLPYRVTQLEVWPRAAEVRPGQVPEFRLTVRVSEGKPGFHVVHAAVYPPRSKIPHREYSANIACNGGRGILRIPFALNDEPGIWRLRFCDAATGVEAGASVTLTLTP